MNLFILKCDWLSKLFCKWICIHIFCQKEHNLLFSVPCYGVSILKHACVEICLESCLWYFSFVVMNTSNLKTSPQSDQRRRNSELVVHQHERTRLVIASTSATAYWWTHSLEGNGPGEVYSQMLNCRRDNFHFQKKLVDRTPCEHAFRNIGN